MTQLQVIDLSLVVPAHDEPETVIGLLRAVDFQCPNNSQLAVVIADDCSEVPLAPAILGETWKHLAVSVVRRDVNGGPGAARNTALKTVKTNWVVFLDSDERPGLGWVDRLINLIDDDKTPPFVEGRVTPPEGTVVTPFVHTIEADASKGQHVGGNILCRKTMLDRVGGFSEKFYDAEAHLHFREDADFYFRVRDAGFESMYVPNLHVIHPVAREQLFLPTILSRRYFFDPLLSKTHPAHFRNLMRERKIGPVSLRQARHWAALSEVGGAVVFVLACMLGRRRLAALTTGALASLVGVNSVALGMGKSVPYRFIPALLLNGVTAPFVYTYKFFQGVVRFRDLPRF